MSSIPKNQIQNLQANQNIQGNGSASGIGSGGEELKYLLKDDGDFILLDTGDYIIL